MSDNAEQKIDTRTTLIAAELCKTHQREALSALQLGPNDTWRAGIVVTQILSTQATIASARFREMCPVDPQVGQMTATLHEIGCCGCALPDEWRNIVRVLRRGMHYAAQVSQKKIRDRNFPYLDGTV